MRYTLLLLFALGCGGPEPRRGQVTNPGDPQFADAALQAERLRLIDKAKAAGVVTKRDVWQTIPRVWVDAALFSQLDFDAKRDLIAVVAAHEFRVAKDQALAPGELLLVVDDRTGKEIAHFDERGFHLD